MQQQRNKIPSSATALHNPVQGDPTFGSWYTASCNSGFCASTIRGER